MERGLALTLWVLVSLGVMSVMLLDHSGVLDLRVEWHRYLAVHALWLMLVPLVYAAICEVARGRESPAVLLVITRALGVVLLTVFALLFACVIYDF